MMGLLGLGSVFRIGIGIALFCALACDFYAFHHIKHLNEVILLQKQEITQEQSYISYYANLYDKIKHDCQLNKKQIIKRYSVIVKEATTPIPQIQIPQEPNQCKALKEMINEASSYFSK